MSLEFKLEEVTDVHRVKLICDYYTNTYTEISDDKFLELELSNKEYIR